MRSRLRGVVLHVPPVIYSGKGNGEKFYHPFQRALRAAGCQVRMVLHERDKVPAQIEADEDLHILEHGRTSHPRVLNTASAYLLPFRYFDPQGVRAFSSLRDKGFDAAAQDPAQAQAFLQRLQQTYVTPRKSRYDQPETKVPVPAGCIAVFLQSEDHPEVDETSHMSLRQMVRALMQREDPRPIVIKPHPRDTNLDTYGWLGRQARKDPRLHILPANLHDILEQAALVVTINSAVGIEALLHCRPLVLCGRADFHHISQTAQSPRELPRAIAEAEARHAAGQIPFAAYLHWFYAEQCLDPTAPDFMDRFLALTRQMGCPIGP